MTLILVLVIVGAAVILIRQVRQLPSVDELARERLRRDLRRALRRNG